jgi:hypothetical protein
MGERDAGVHRPLRPLIPAMPCELRRGSDSKGQGLDIGISSVQGVNVSRIQVEEKIEP